MAKRIGNTRTKNLSKSKRMRTKATLDIRMRKSELLILFVAEVFNKIYLHLLVVVSLKETWWSNG